ncbi:MAG: multidrug efflux RND transporter permease subunit [Gemmataceae bacterium]|nr:multidrug efflux RND transporter permease subunit [Gemmataceae bacterium]MDW8264585.1 multidrug efflux RND transporter permease subunit [Gemmataceae bacterium]
MARFFVDRPIFAWVLSILITIVGLVCLWRLPIAQYPPIVPPNIQVSCVYPGASATTLANTVAMPIEEQVNGVEGMIYMSSTCSNNGSYQLNVTFEVGTDVHTALMLVQTRVQLAMPQLPDVVQRQGINVEMQSPSILLAVSLYSDRDPSTGTYRYDPLFLSNYAEISIYDRLARLPGVAAVNYLGQRQYSMRVWLDPQKLAALSLTASDVVQAIREQNVQVASGSIGQEPVPPGQAFQLTLNTLGRLTTREEFGAIIVKIGDDGRLVHLRDVAHIDLGAQNSDLIGTIDGQPAVTLAVYALPQANSLAVAAEVKNLLRELSQHFPPGLRYSTAYDTTPFIQHSIEDIFYTLIIAAILVIVVVLVFLQDWRAMLLPMIDIAVSLIGTFAVMAALGFSLNNLSMFGLVLAIGIVVDDAIVVVENIERWMGKGLPVREATVKAMEEITGPIIGITLVLSSVFLPAALIPGLTGEFFRQFALTIATSMLISATNAMTMAPARAAAWIKPHGVGHEHVEREALPRVGYMALLGAVSFALLSPLLGHLTLSEAGHGSLVWLARLALAAPGAVAGWFLARPINRVLAGFFTLFNQAFDAFARGYTRLVGMLLRVSVVVLVVYGGLLVLTYVGLTTAPTGFIPVQDQGYLLCVVELPDAASVQRTAAVLEKINRIAHQVPGVRQTVGCAGFSVFYQCNAPNWGTMFIVLDDFVQRREPERQANAIIQTLNQLCYQEIPEAKVAVLSAPPVPGIGQSSGFQLQIQDSAGFGYDALEEAAAGLVAQANQQPELQNVFTSFKANSPQLWVEIDREKARQMGVALSDVFETLNVNIGSYFVNLFNKFGRVWQVNVQADGRFRTDPEQLSLLYVRNNRGQSVPLASLVTVRNDSGPVFVMRYNDEASVAVIGAAAPGYSSGQAIAVMEDLCHKNLPEGMHFEWTSISYQEVKANRQGLSVGGVFVGMTILVFAFAVLLVFLVLAALYESWALPLAIMLVVPMCLLSAVGGLVWIAGKDVDLFSQIGFVVLVGLAAKNAILIVAYAEEQQAAGLSRREATLQACLLRLRPILMTSFAFILGVYPLVVAEGAGWEMRRSLGTAVFSGMIGVTAFGIFLTPVFYDVIVGLRDRRRPMPPPASA